MHQREKEYKRKKKKEKLDRKWSEDVSRVTIDGEKQPWPKS